MTFSDAMHYDQKVEESMWTFLYKSMLCVQMSAISFRVFPPFQMSMNVILTLTTVVTMPTVLTQTGHLFAIAVMDFLETE